MNFEVEFLPVGEGEKNGDAIVVRYGEPGRYTIMVYDGGTQAAGNALVEHVKHHYRTDYVDHVVNSHPDMDHASGLSVVLEELRVGTLWLHRPWQYSHLIVDYFKDGRITNASLKDRLQNKLSGAYNLEALAIKKKITIAEPFQETKIGAFHVLSPDRDWYVHDLIADFEKTPDARKIATRPLVVQDSGRRSFITEAKKAVIKWVAERWDLELLREDVETSAENESSAILCAYMKDHKYGILLTGDAGLLALNKAVDYLERFNVSAPNSINLIQMPHHGGRHNVSTTVLDRLVGRRLPTIPQTFSKWSIASAGAGSAYPRHMVRNAFMRRGAKPYGTKGGTVRFSRGMPDRGWKDAESLGFSDSVESW